MSIIAAFIFGFCSFLIGVQVGLAWHMKRIERKKQELFAILNTIKKQNNTMLSNISKVYNAVYGEDGQWSEMDDFLMPMWME